MPRSQARFPDTFASLLEARARAAAGTLSEPASPRQARATHASHIELGRIPDDGSPHADGIAETLARIYGEGHAPASTSEPPTCDPETIARELGLGPGLTARELESIRRSFALTNHPDRILPSQRTLATCRMAVANMLIDRALREKRRLASR
jgi:hypothetical protein